MRSTAEKALLLLTAILAATACVISLITYVRVGSVQLHSPTAPSIDQQLADFKKLASSLHDQSVQISSLAGGSNAQQTLELLQAIEASERRLNDPKSWPQDPDQAVRFRSELDELLNRTPPLLRTALADRFDPLLWSAQAFLLLNTANVPSDPDDDSLEEEVRLLTEVVPNGVPHRLVGRFKTSAEQIVGSSAVQRKRIAIESAQAVLLDGGDASLAWLHLGPFEEGDEEIAKLRGELREREIIDTCKSLASRIDRARPISDPLVKQMVASDIHTTAITFKADAFLDDTGAALSESTLQEIDNVIRATTLLLEECSDDNSRRNAARHREYQRWALQQIRDFDGWYYDNAVKEIEQAFASFDEADTEFMWYLLYEFPDVMNFLSTKTGVDLTCPVLTVEEQRKIYAAVHRSVRPGWNHADALAYRTTREAMVKYLLPIEESLLDPPVRSLFDKAFQRGWTKIEESNDQLHVAKRTAEVAKETPLSIARTRSDPYEQWALGQIQSFKEEFDARKQTAKRIYELMTTNERETLNSGEIGWYSGVHDMIESTGCVHNPAGDYLRKALIDAVKAKWDERQFVTEASFRIVRDAMVKYLIPVDTAFVGERTAAFHRGEWCRGWNELRGRGEQSCVKESAKGVKKVTRDQLRNSEAQ